MRQNLIKIKPLTKEQIIISIDRLTRFKEPETKYLRVFKDLIINNLISPKYKKSELDSLEYGKIKEYAEKIFNNSLENLGLALDNDYHINQKLYDYENSVFNINEDVQILIKNNINYKACLNLIEKDSPLNLKWLKSLPENEPSNILREKYGLRFPIEKVVISEGITEEILLPEFGRLCGYDFDKNGVYIISAGGKNQVVKLFYKLYDCLKIPVFILMDKDAKENYNEIKPRLREFDRVHLINCGEFEDMLPVELVKKTLLYGLKNISMIELETVNQNSGMVKILEEIFKHRGMHEFKKSEFAQMVQKNLNSKDDISDEIADIIKEIQNTGKKSKVMVDN